MRTGPFWDGVLGRQPIPPAARTLGFEFVHFDDDAATIELTFTATEHFTNPAGNVLGAFLAAMLYDTVGPALLALLAPDKFQSTRELHVRFQHAVKPGRIRAVGHVVRRDGETAELEAHLFDETGVELASATAVADVIPLAEAPTAP